MSLFKLPGHGVFRNVKELRLGCRLIFSRKGLFISKYWSLESKPHEDSIETTIKKVKELVIDAIERQLISDVPVCTFLSGGLDSSAITSVAASYYIRNNLGQLNSYSIDYVDNDKYFKPTDFQPNSDNEWAGRTSKVLKTNHHNVLLDTPQLAAALEQAVIAKDLPGMADIDSSLYLFCREIKKNATVALSGECADEVLSEVIPGFIKAIC